MEKKQNLYKQYKMHLIVMRKKPKALVRARINKYIFFLTRLLLFLLLLRSNIFAAAYELNPIKTFKDELRPGLF